MTVLHRALLLWIGALVLASCKSKEEAEWIPAPTTATVRGVVRDSDGPRAGVVLHAVYELDTLSLPRGATSLAPDPSAVIHSQRFQITEDSIVCEYELLAEWIGFNDRIRMSVNTRRELGMESFEMLRDSSTVVRWPARNGSGGHIYFAFDDSMQNGVDYSYTLAAHCANRLRLIAGTGSVNTNPGLTEIPDYALYQNYPNPVLDSTRISYHLNASGWLDVVLNNSSGRFARNIWSSTQSFRMIGLNVHQLGMNRLCNGLYETRMTVADVFQASRKLLKNQTDYEVLRDTPGSAVTDVDGNYEMAVSVGDTLLLTTADNELSGSAVLKRVKIVALADGYLAADTTLEMIPGEAYDANLMVEREP